MTYPKVCLNCNTPFEAKRDSARFCGDDCRNEWHAENRAASSQAPGQRVEGHALDEVRGLLEEHKGDWTAIVREHARRTLLATGYLSAADFVALGVPDEHCNLPGAQLGAFVNAGYMEAISFKRWSAEAKASRKSGKYWVYRITQKGKEQLSPLVGSSSGAPGGTGVATARSGESEIVGVGTEGEQTSSDTLGANSGEKQSGAGPTLPLKNSASPPTRAVTGSGSPDHPEAQLLKLEGEKPKPRNAIFDDDWGEAA